MHIHVQEREHQQQEKIKALHEEREKAKMAMAQLQAIEAERLRAERARNALELAARQKKEVCARCAQEYVVDDNELGACKCCHNPSSIAQVRPVHACRFGELPCRAEACAF
jgi:hypothetical protein